MALLVLVAEESPPGLVVVLVPALEVLVALGVAEALLIGATDDLPPEPPGLAMAEMTLDPVAITPRPAMTASATIGTFRRRGHGPIGSSMPLPGVPMMTHPLICVSSTR